LWELSKRKNVYIYKLTYVETILSLINKDDLSVTVYYDDKNDYVQTFNFNVLLLEDKTNFKYFINNITERNNILNNFFNSKGLYNVISKPLFDEKFINDDDFLNEKV